MGERGLLLHSLGNDGEEAYRVLAESPCDPCELHDIESSLAELDFGDPAVVLTEPLGQSALAQACRLARLAQEAEQLSVGRGEN